MIVARRAERLETARRKEGEDDFAFLIEQARRGVKEASGDLFAAQRPLLLALARGSLDYRLASKLAPEDLVQETFLEAHLSLHQFQGGNRAEFGAWLKAILLNRLFNSVRHFRRTKRRSIDRELPQLAVEAAMASARDPHVAPNVELELRETTVQLTDGIRHMAPLVRAVVIERACQGASFREIGLRHHCSAKVARRHWMQGLRQLLRHMNADDHLNGVPACH